MIKVYNSLTKKKEEFKAKDSGLVRMYTCGVTVYDDCHIGHGRSLYIFDVIRRYLEYRGYRVNFVRNITDIDDKIINRARELGISWRQLTDKYLNKYRRDLERLGLKPPDYEPKATENIEDMIKSIAGLIDKGYAYPTDTGVYFEVKKFKDYGSLSGQKISQMKDAVRIQADENKKDFLDFALWKVSKDDEPGWVSPWGRGRPGWHIECSVMCQKYLKRETLDIHGGGRDLIFPHHENELAQSMSLSGSPLANYWLHHGLLTICGRKMSKSLGNFVTLAEVLEKYPADVLKLFYLQAHYSSSIDFSWEKMEQAKKAYEHIEILKNKLEGSFEGQKRAAKLSGKANAEVEIYRKCFSDALDDDFNMPKALAVLFDFISHANRELAYCLDDKLDFLVSCRDFLAAIAKVFGFNFISDKSTVMPEEDIMKLIEQRNQHRIKNEFTESDRIRDELLDKGIILEDTKNGTIWRKK